MGQILLVEDETFIAEMIQDALEDRGLAVKSAHTDRGAYALLEGEARSFTMLIADINLGPGVSGFAPRTPIRDWLKPFGPSAVTGLLLFFAIRYSRPTNQSWLSGVPCVW